jgi:hypothetical protein
MSASKFPPLKSKPSNKRCTNCSSIMSLYQLPGHYGQTIDIDACLDCNAIWFDQWESSQLSPDGVVSLFQLIHERGGAASAVGAKLKEGLRCVSCGDGMKLVNDRVKNTRFVYQSCRHGHGRLTTFYNFLSEKQFVRELTKAERAKLCATVRQVKCSGCGAPVDLAKSDACEYCRAPVSVFDRDAAKKAIDHYLKERHKHLEPTPSPNYGHFPRNDRRGWDAWDTLYAADIASDLLWALGRAATRGLGRVIPPTAAGVGAGTVLADAGGFAGAPLENVPGGLMDTLGATVASGTGAPLATATDLLFNDSAASGLASALSSGNVLASASDALAGGGLTSATDALFGSGGSAASDLFSSTTNELSNVASGALGSMSDLGGEVTGSIGETIGGGIGDVASSFGDGAADLVSDGIGSLISSIFS